MREREGTSFGAGARGRCLGHHVVVRLGPGMGQACPPDTFFACDIANKIENMPPSHVPNNDIFEAAVFLYETKGEDSERAESAANLFRQSLGTNAIIEDTLMDNDTFHIKLVRPWYIQGRVAILDYQWVSVCKQGYTAMPPTHALETYTQELDSLLPVEEYGFRRVRLTKFINAHTWVPVRESHCGGQLLAWR